MTVGAVVGVGGHRVGDDDYDDDDVCLMVLRI